MLILKKLLFLCTNANILCLVVPSVEVVASRTKVALGESTTLHCGVTRTNPAIDTYVWMHENSGIALVDGNDTLTVMFATEQHFGVITCNATNAAGRSGSGSVMIERGCECCMWYI